MLSLSVFSNFISSTLMSHGPGVDGLYPNFHEQISQSTPTDDS